MSDSDRDEDGTAEKDGGSSILEDGGVDTDERAGRSLGIEPDKEPDDETKEEIEAEREERLDPDNRPDTAEVDNTGRHFDHERGMFTDSEEYDESGDAPYVDPEDPNTTSADDEESDGSDDSENSEDKS